MPDGSVEFLRKSQADDSSFYSEPMPGTFKEFHTIYVLKGGGGG